MTDTARLLRPVALSGASMRPLVMGPRGPPILLPEPLDRLGSDVVDDPIFKPLQRIADGAFLLPDSSPKGQEIANMAKFLLTIPEAGEMISISRATTYKLISSGQLRPIKIGRACRIPLAEIERYLSELALQQYGDAEMALPSRVEVKR